MNMSLIKTNNAYNKNKEDNYENEEIMCSNSNKKTAKSPDNKICDCANKNLNIRPLRNFCREK